MFSRQPHSAYQVSAWIMAILTSVTIWRVGRFPFLDEAIFKGAGKHWAEGKGFICPELSGFLDLVPPVEEIFFLHVPIYPFLFGLLVKCFGFGWDQAVLFDAFIHGALIVCTFYLARQFRRFSEIELGICLPQWLDLLAPVAIIPLAQAGRPDELAMCFGFIGLTLLMNARRSLSAIAISGASYGLCAATSVGAAVVLGFFAFFFIFTGPAPFKRNLFDAVVWQVVALLVIALAVSPILLNHPTALGQFLEHARLVTKGKSFMEFTTNGWVHARHRILPVGGFLVLAIIALSLFRRSNLRRWYLSTWPGVVFGTAFIVALLPGEFLYFWFFTPWLFAASAVTIASLWTIHGRRLALTGLVILTLFACPVFIWGALQWTCMLTLPAEQRAAHNAKLIRKLVPEGATVLTDYYWSFLPGRFRTYNPTFSSIKNLDEIDFVLLSPIGGGGPGKYQYMRSVYEKLVAERFTPVFNNLPQKALTFGGVKLTNTTWGFGFILFSRKVPHRSDGIDPSF